MISINISAEGLDSFIRGLNDFSRQLRNRSEILRKVKSDQVRRWSANFLSEGAEYGKHWEPTSEHTVGYSGRTLYQTGGTYRYFMSLNNAGQVDNDDIEWEFYNAMNGRGGQYPVSHHEGYSLGSSRVPSRMLWDLDPEDEDRIEQGIGRWVLQVAERTLG